MKSITSLLAVPMLGAALLFPAFPAAAAAPVPVNQTVGQGTVHTYTYKAGKLHVFNTGDPLGDACFIVETRTGLVGIEMPSFTKDLAAWKSYVKSLGKPLDAVFITNHPTGASYVKGVRILGTQAAKDSVNHGMIHGITTGLVKTFGKDFHGAPDQIEITEVVKPGDVKVAGLTFDVIPAGDSYEIAIPAFNVIHTHMLGKKVHSIIPSEAALDQALKTAEGYQAKKYDLILSSHAGAEGQDAVAEKIRYLKAEKKIIAGSKSKADFIAAMEKAFPGYTGKNYLEMSASGLFPAKK